MPATSAVLTGLSLATGIAREATDGIPIVKQVLGVASRIVGLAEQIDKNREDLHALAGRARKMDATITAIVADREVGDNMLRSLEDMNGVLRAVETYFKTHISRGRVRRTLGYIFTARKDVDRLRGEFDDRLRELEFTANIDANIFSRGNSRFIGEVRNVRHCEITLLNPISRVSLDQGEDRGTFHLATCEGSNKVFVVRSMTLSGLDEYQKRRIEDHNRVIEQFSLIQNRHPTIACLYGRNLGPNHNRFVVLDAGVIRPLEDALEGETADIAIVGPMVAQLVDVSCHLRKHGAVWWMGALHSSILYVDNTYKPIIGLDNDLYTPWTGLDIIRAYVIVSFGIILNRSTTTLHSQEYPCSDTDCGSTTWSKDLLGELINAGYQSQRQENMVRREDITRFIPLNQESRMYLHREDRGCRPVMPKWGFVLLRLAAGIGNWEMRFVEAWYEAYGHGGPDVLIVFCVDGGGEVIYHTETRFKIPHSAAAEVRQRLGIAVIAEGTDYFYWRGPKRHSATSTECIGWSRWQPDWESW